MQATGTPWAAEIVYIRGARAPNSRLHIWGQMHCCGRLGILSLPHLYFSTVEPAPRWVLGKEIDGALSLPATQQHQGRLYCMSIILRRECPRTVRSVAHPLVGCPSFFLSIRPRRLTVFRALPS